MARTESTMLDLATQAPSFSLKDTEGSSIQYKLYSSIIVNKTNQKKFLNFAKNFKL